MLHRFFIVAGLMGCLAGSLHAAPRSPESAGLITVDPSTTYQTIEGFGTCLISWGNYPGETYTEEFADFYLDTVGMNMLRIELNGFLHPEVTDSAEISWEKIEPNSRARTFIDFATKLKQRDPAVRLIATVWTPPPWMKLNGISGNGTGDVIENRTNRGIRAQSYETRAGVSTNRVDPAKYEHFVQWLVAVTAFHREEGIPLYGLSLANEPRFSQWYGSCIWTAEDYATALGMLGPALEAAGFGDIVLFGPEDMTGHLHDGGTLGMIDAIRADPAAAAALDRWATHGYTDGVQMDTTEDSSRQLWEYVAADGKPYWMTEGGTGGHEWPTPIRNGLGMALHNSLVAGHASAFVPWQISEPRPSTHAIAVLDQVTPKTAAGMQFFRTIPIGAQRISAEPAFGPVKVSAFRHPETGETAIVLINPGREARMVNVTVEGIRGRKGMAAYRTSSDEEFARAEPVEFRRGRATVTLGGESMVSLRGKLD